ncbi:TPA: hypothetical protein ACH3X1_015468 [Trebouxia sp. C0004]
MRSQVSARGVGCTPYEVHSIGGTHCLLGCLIQAGNANYLQKALSNQTSNFQVIEEEEGQVRVENIVQLGPLLAIKAGGTCAPEGASRTMVSLDDIRAELGPFRIPLPKGNSSSSSQPAYVDWLYLDDDLRITRGSKGSMFIHTKS